MTSAWQNHEVTVFASAARTETETSAVFDNLTGKGLQLFLDISAASGTSPTLDIKVQKVDPVTGTAFDFKVAVAFAQKTTTGTDDLIVYPGLPATANETVNDILPSQWVVVATIGGTTPSFTFTLGAVVLQ